jgi:hypothetical protein
MASIYLHQHKPLAMLASHDNFVSFVSSQDWLIDHDGVGIETRLDSLVRFRADLSAQLLAGTVVEIEYSAPMVGMCFMFKIKQVFHYGGRDAALLKPCLCVMRHRQHDSTSFFWPVE